MMTENPSRKPLPKRPYRIQLEDDYAMALGRAAYNFAYLEWGVSWIVECFEPGSLDKLRRETSGYTAKEFARLMNALPEEAADRAELVAAAESFKKLVNDRNALFHGAPYTAKGGAQQLQHNGRHGRRNWTESAIVDLALAFEDLAIEVCRLLHSGPYKAWLERTDEPPDEQWAVKPTLKG